MRKPNPADKPLKKVTQRIWDLAQQQGYKDKGELRRKVVELTGLTNIDSGNWSNMWFGKKPWAYPVLVRVAYVLGTRADDLLGKLPPIPFVADVTAFSSFDYPDRLWLPDEKLGGAINFRWEDTKTLKNIYALRVKDCSMLPVFNQGTILYAQKNSQPEEFHDFDAVVYCDPQNQAQVRLITLEPEQITLVGLNSAIKPLTLPRKHLRDCDLIILTLRQKI